MLLNSGKGSTRYTSRNNTKHICITLPDEDFWGKMKLKMGQIFFVGFIVVSFALAADNADSSSEKDKVDAEKVEYAKGSVCGYCEYCKVNLYRKLCNLNTN